MSASPYTGAAQGFSEMASSCADVADQLEAAKNQLIETQAGKAADAAVEQLDGYIATLRGLSDNATDMVSACAVQADADNAFASAPKPDDIEAQRDRARAAVRLGSAIAAAREDAALRQMVDERDSALIRHTADTSATPPKFPTVVEANGWRRGSGSHDGDMKNDTGGVELLPLNRPAFGGGGGGGMPSLPPMSLSDVGSHLSGDTAGAAHSAAAPMPPQMPPMTNMPAGGAPAGGMPGAMPGGMPNMSPMSMQQRKSQDQRGANLPTDLSGDGGMSAGSGLAAGAAAGVAASGPDRNSGTATGVSTRADVSGKGSGAVTASAAPNPNAGGGGGRPPMGPMGGMGGLGGGHGLHAQNSKERPNIVSRDPDLVGQGTADAAVDGGLIGRHSAEKPEPDFGGEPEPSKPERKAG